MCRASPSRAMAPASTAPGPRNALGVLPLLARSTDAHASMPGSATGWPRHTGALCLKSGVYGRSWTPCSGRRGNFDYPKTTPPSSAVAKRCRPRGVRESVALGCVGPNQLKAFSRCGMGPCQGRLCGLTIQRNDRQAARRAGGRSRRAATAAAGETVDAGRVGGAHGGARINAGARLNPWLPVTTPPTPSLSAVACMDAQRHCIWPARAWLSSLWRRTPSAATPPAPMRGACAGWAGRCRRIPLAVAALASWHRIRDLVDDDCGFASSCQVKVAETESELHALRQRRETVLSLGFEHEEIIDQAQLRELVPTIAPHCVGGMAVHGDGHANPFLTVQAFKRKARALGVRFLEGARVEALQKPADTWLVRSARGRLEAPILVNCAGAWGGHIAAMLGEHAPVEAQALMLMNHRPSKTVRQTRRRSPGPDAFLQAIRQRHDSDRRWPPGPGRAGIQPTHLNFRGLAASAITAAALFPSLRRVQIVRCWAGIEGQMPDGIPVIGASAAKGAYHAFGFSGHGFALGPIVGRIIADSRCQRRHRFTHRRFRDRPVLKCPRFPREHFLEITLTSALVDMTARSILVLIAYLAILTGNPASARNAPLVVLSRAGILGRCLTNDRIRGTGYGSSTA